MPTLVHAWTWLSTRTRSRAQRLVLFRPTYPQHTAKIAVQTPPTYLPTPSRRASSLGPTYLPLGTSGRGYSGGHKPAAPHHRRCPHHARGGPPRVGSMVHVGMSVGGGSSSFRHERRARGELRRWRLWLGRTLHRSPRCDGPESSTYLPTPHAMPPRQAWTYLPTPWA